jgi:AraC family transcriptional regulator, transcriptional activator of pobA
MVVYQGWKLMQPIKKIPTYSICNLMGSDRCATELVVRRLSDYVRDLGDIQFPHRHDFYQIVLFTQGTGTHTIDFEQYQVAPHQVYYMSPGQTHTWQFAPETDGYIINFHESLFNSAYQDVHLLRQFPIFTQSQAESPVNSLELSCCADLELTFAQLLAEFYVDKPFKLELLRSLLLTILVKLSRAVPAATIDSAVKHQIQVIRDFERLIELHYKDKHLPKEYAELLFISPNYLNALTTAVNGKKAGEMIRDRLLLEAKRMLVNSDERVGQIADYLHFDDNAYFTRFFKKNVGSTPEQFRASYLGKPREAEL